MFSYFFVFTIIKITNKYKNMFKILHLLIQTARLCILAFLANLVFPAFGEWDNWRGPNFNGSAGSDDELPSSFDKSKGVKWVSDLPGSSAATPIVYKGLVFVPSVKISTNKRGDGKLMAICLNASNGRVVWEREAGSGYKPGNGDGFDYQLHDRSNYASPSPVVGNGKVYFFFGNGDLVAYDFEGNLVWRRNLQKDYGDFNFQWTFSASPTFYNNNLYLPVLQRDEPVHGRGNNDAKSFLLCIDSHDGKTIWKHVRSSPAKKESLESFGTIIPHNNELIVAGGDVLTSHDPGTGTELWRWGSWNPGHKEQWWRLVPSPVVGDNVILVCAPKRAPVFAIEIPKQNINDSPKLRWSTNENPSITSDVPTPLFYRNKFYVLSDLKKNLSKIDPVTAKTEWSLDLPGKYKWRSSPTAGDGKVFLMNHNATVLVVDAVSGKTIHVTEMGDSYDDNTRSSISISRSNLYVRTNKKLYCIE
jgi:outer membrane protein assembly factor BamB